MGRTMGDAMVAMVLPLVDAVERAMPHGMPWGSP